MNMENVPIWKMYVENVHWYTIQPSVGILFIVLHRFWLSEQHHGRITFYDLFA